MTEPGVSADVIAERLGAPKDSIYTCLAQKEMPAHRVGRPWKFKVDDWVAGSKAHDAHGGP